MPLWEFASLKFVGQTDRLETQTDVDIAVLSLKAGNSSRISILPFGGRISSSLGDLFLFSGGPSTDQMRPTHIMEVNLLFFESADLNVNHI